MLEQHVQVSITASRIPFIARYDPIEFPGLVFVFKHYLWLSQEKSQVFFSTTSTRFLTFSICPPNHCVYSYYYSFSRFPHSYTQVLAKGM
ncbi:hypothetical protein BHE74_00000824 [Ensete ventricosum]|nr:hypothetical protein GW17_00007811 [Ensete ventricosum]RWW90034.1 hypothetical protein BHE74_00000824 [Ensete ventricosum]RZR87607.1 hypothetical protein BHM03_00015066 [Ensete ventricosum]